MIPKPIRIIGFILYCLFWILVAHLFIGCANTSYKTIGDSGWNSMSEDAQDDPIKRHSLDEDYPTKYNTMDSPDGRRNPNAQVNIFGITY
jgi:hypothetical protein